MTIHQTLSQLANQCVMCGLCIPHCPTYQVFQTESESPRGRISLFKALADKKLDMTQGMFVSLDHCLNCRACERMCPSRVEYSTISRLGRELMTTQGASSKQYLKHPLKQKLAEKLLLSPSLHPFMKLASKTISPMQQFLPEQIGQLTKEVASATASSTPFKSFYPVEKSIGQVVLFKGCSGELFDHAALSDSIRLLNACGYNVVLPDDSSCCGAIKLRQGDAQGQRTLEHETTRSLEPWLANSQAIVVLNNSCAGQLREYGQLSENEESSQKIIAEKTISKKTRDIVAFLFETLKTSNVQFAPLDETVLLHISCSLKNVLKEVDLLAHLLERIPEIRLKKLNDQFCCGAAGSYMLSYPDVANRLLDDKIEDVVQQEGQLIVSSNLGCTLHFKQGLEKRGKTIEVIHPVRLLARQLIKDPFIEESKSP